MGWASLGQNSIDLPFHLDCSCRIEWRWLCVYGLNSLSLSLSLGNNSRILYSFEDSADGRFSIQQHSGLVRVERPLVRTQAGYTLRVRATDQGSPRRLSSVCSVLVSVLSVNDRPPAFQNRDYGVTVSEDVTLGTQVVRVFAASGDPKATADITYSIVNGNEHGMFSMDSHTGSYTINVNFIVYDIK